MKRPHVFRQINGKACDKKPMQYPYTYTRYCLYKNNWQSTDEAVYSDRLSGWYDNYNEIKERYLGRGNYFSAYEPEDIEKFLCSLFNKKIILTGVEEECNCSNGYPYWIFYYRVV